MANEALTVAKPSLINGLITSLADVISIGDIVAKSGMFPDVSTQAKAVMIILAGQEVGIPPLAALRGMFVAKGKAEFHAGLLAAMIKASGKYNYTVREHTEQRCVLDWFENGKPVGYSQFAIDDAKRAGLIKLDSNWQKFPKAMVFARALTSGQRVYAPDVAIGAAYAPGEIAEVEIEDIPAAQTVPISIAQAEPQWVAKEEIHEILEPAREKLAEAKAQQSGAASKAKPKPQAFGPQNRAHSEEVGKRFDSVIHKLTGFGVTGRDLLSAVNNECDLTREVYTRYELTDDEVAQVCDVFEAWTKKLESKATKKGAS
jgi:hypothetical protein